MRHLTGDQMRVILDGVAKDKRVRVRMLLSRDCTLGFDVFMSGVEDSLRMASLNDDASYYSLLKGISWMCTSDVDKLEAESRQILLPFLDRKANVPDV